MKYLAYFIIFFIKATDKEFKKWYENEKGNLCPLAMIITNHFFQRIIGLNKDSSWQVNFTSRVRYPKKIKMGKNVKNSFAVSGGCYIQAYNGIIFGDNSIFAPGVMIISANHGITDKSQCVQNKPIIIGNNCWIGANAVILPGVEIGDNSIVGAGAIVTKKFPSNVIIAGNPAKIVKEIKMDYTNIEQNTIT